MTHRSNGRDISSRTLRTRMQMRTMTTMRRLCGERQKAHWGMPGCIFDHTSNMLAALCHTRTMALRFWIRWANSIALVLGTHIGDGWREAVTAQTAVYDARPSPVTMWKELEERGQAKHDISLVPGSARCFSHLPSRFCIYRYQRPLSPCSLFFGAPSQMGREEGICRTFSQHGPTWSGSSTARQAGGRPAWGRED